MNTIETAGMNVNHTVEPVPSQHHGRYSYQKVLDARKQPIRGLWRQDAA